MMNTFTLSTCDRCGNENMRKESTSFPPVGWALLDMHTRTAGAGWAGSSDRVEALLCPTCITATIAHLRTGQRARTIRLTAKGEEMVR